MGRAGPEGGDGDGGRRDERSGGTLCCKISDGLIAENYSARLRRRAEKGPQGRAVVLHRLPFAIAATGARSGSQRVVSLRATIAVVKIRDRGSSGPRRGRPPSLLQGAAPRLRPCPRRARQDSLPPPPPYRRLGPAARHISRALTPRAARRRRP